MKKRRIKLSNNVLYNRVTMILIVILFAIGGMFLTDLAKSEPLPTSSISVDFHVVKYFNEGGAYFYVLTNGSEVVLFAKTGNGVGNGVALTQIISNIKSEPLPTGSDISIDFHVVKYFNEGGAYFYVLTNGSEVVLFAKTGNGVGNGVALTQIISSTK